MLLPLCHQNTHAITNRIRQYSIRIPQACRRIQMLDMRQDLGGEADAGEAREERALPQHVGQQ